jgi:DNA polymerase
MNDKQIRMFKLLDEQISKCKDCMLYENGRTKPYWTPESKYCIIGEAPGKDEVIKNEPFIGRAGNILWSNMSIPKTEFLIINSVNCRPMVGTKNGKPTEEQKFKCRKWRRKYITVLQPNIILLLGDHAISTVVPERGNVIKNNAKTLYSVEFNADCIRSVHPALSMYDSENGPRLLKESIEMFNKLAKL